LKHTQLFDDAMSAFEPFQNNLETYSWAVPVEMPELQSQSIHIWLVRLDTSYNNYSELIPVLSKDEQRRINRFGSDKALKQFVITRACLRKILGHYLKVQPEQIIFEYNKRGKPFIPRRGLQFNVSHSKDIALVAVTPAANIGIDVEFVRKGVNYEGIARRFFTSHEQQFLSTIPCEQRVEAFYRCWTKKEAFAKAIGGGLFKVLHAFDTTMVCDRSSSHWLLKSFCLGNGSYIAAVAAKTKNLQLECWRWQGR
jgi:4'-phosphopantetheinyl transferase